ncbi:MAG: hypothetical protein GQ574_10470 [Crocinitomix sp.]|nr:hypothetical protein [Crocinitomix sp.]
MRSNRFFISLLLLTLSALCYLIWWSYCGVYSGDYAHLYGYLNTDKIAFISIILLVIVFLISSIKLWHDLKYLGLLVGGFLVVLIWSQFFYPGTETLRLTGCFESQCSNISIRDNGTFWMTRSNQNECYSYRGNYIVKGGNIHLYDDPGFESEYQLDAIGELIKDDCLRVIAEDFGLWSDCFVLP